MTAVFEMVKYHSRTYPSNVPIRTEEIAAHFDIKEIRRTLNYSLHTEYSFGKRKFDSKLINKFSEIVSAKKCGIPQLWKSELWASEFADFIVALVNGSSAPEIIEIHPPFDDYTNMKKFVSDYSIFESKIKERFPNVEIYIENRCGSYYQGGKFLISKINDIKDLCQQIECKHLFLRIAFDVPQIYTAHYAKSKEEYISILESVKELRTYIGCVHLWGKKLGAKGRKIPHYGDLNSYFENKSDKLVFLDSFVECFNDDIIRKMVLEVNSTDVDLSSILNDLQMSGINFV